jgi:hypothetical protein
MTTHAPSAVACVPKIVPTTGQVFIRSFDTPFIALHTPLLIENNKLTYPYPREEEDEPPNPLKGLSLRHMARAVRRAKTSWMCGTKCGR